MLKGALTAIVTPFKNGEIDWNALSDLIEFQINEGIDGLVPMGTTGESPAVSHDEHKQVVKYTVDLVKKRVPVVAGAGSNSTAEAVELTQFAKDAGADACLQVTPYYNKPTQEGCYQHFKTIAKVGLPIVVYNIASRTGVNIETPTLARMAELPEIVAVKEASGSIGQMADVYLECGHNLTMLSGDDGVTLPLMAVGGKGVISVLSNLVPAKMAKLCKLCEAGENQEALKLFMHLLPMMKAIFLETNPIPIKTAMALKGIIPSDEMRLPMTPMSEAAKQKLITILKQAGEL
jgi:4-hydroxy-tetrahydrodipicolinate synthase